MQQTLLQISLFSQKKKQQCHILREGVIVLQNTWHCSTKHSRNTRENVRECQHTKKHDYEVIRFIDIWKLKFCKISDFQKKIK